MVKRKNESGDKSQIQTLDTKKTTGRRTNRSVNVITSSNIRETSDDQIKLKKRKKQTPSVAQVKKMAAEHGEDKLDESSDEVLLNNSDDSIADNQNDSLNEVSLSLSMNHN